MNDVFLFKKTEYIEEKMNICAESFLDIFEKTKTYI
jgi:hypothetical protein